MISMTMDRPGISRCPNAAYAGAGAKVAFDGGTRVRWERQHVAVVRIADLLPVTAGDNATRLSAPSERSP